MYAKNCHRTRGVVTIVVTPTTPVVIIITIIIITSNYASVHKPRYGVHRWDDTQNHKGTDTVKIEISIEVLM